MRKNNIFSSAFEIRRDDEIRVQNLPRRNKVIFFIIELFGEIKKKHKTKVKKDKMDNFTLR